jgi:hypothetical protein
VTARLVPAAVLALVPGLAWAALAEPPALGPVPIDFILFGLVLAGVAIFHHHTLRVAVIGLAAIAVYKVLFSPFATGAGLPDWAPTCSTSGC